jgi:hypothetical protein
VNLRFKISQHSRDELLIKNLVLFNYLINYLGCGKCYLSREVAEWTIARSDEINQKLIPILTKYSLSGVKRLDFEWFKKASDLIKNKTHLTSEGIALLKAIKDEMNNR